MRRLAALCLLLSACSGETDDHDVAATSEALFAAGGLPFWDPKVIPVCWENVEDRSVENWDTYRAWVKDAAESTWGRHAQVSFTGWGLCHASSRGIRILIADQREHTLAVGQALDGVPNGMSLNFRFQNDTPRLYCQTWRYNCIRAQAIHEFGHALGFEHEQNRQDNNGRCTDHAEPNPYGVYLTDYDPSSVMNYCSSGEYTFLNPTELSYLDTYGYQTMYGWQPLSNQFSAGWPTWTKVAAVSRARGLLSVFRVQADGRVYTSEGWHGAGASGEWTPVGTFAGFPYGANVTAVVRDPQTIDLFAVASDGSVYRTWRDFRQASWQSWRKVGIVSAPPGALVRGLARTPAQIDLVVTGSDSGVYYFPLRFSTGLCLGCPSSWARIGNLVTYAPPTLISTEVNEIGVFAKDANGAVLTAFKADTTGWYGWYPLPAVTSWPYTPVAAAVRPKKIDLFVAGWGGGVQTSSYTPTSGWSSWSSLGGPDVPYWGHVEALARHADALELFATASGGRLLRNRLDTQVIPNRWGGWHLQTSVFEGSQSNGAPVTAIAHPEGHVRNPFFSRGTLWGWTVMVNGVPAPEQAGIIDYAPYYDVRLPAGPSAYPTETVLSQWITIPRVSPRLRLYYTPRCTDDGDHFRIELRDSYGTVLMQPVAPVCASGTPRLVDVDVSAVAGRTVELRMVNVDDGDATPAATTISSPVQVTFWNSLDTWPIYDPAKGESDVFVVDDYGRLLSSRHDEQ